MSKWSIPSPEYKLSQESAEALVGKIIAFYGLNVDTLDADMRESTEATFNKLADFARLGMLDIKSESPFVIVQNLLDADGKTVETIEYAELQGKHKVAMGSVDRGDTYGRSYALLGSMSGLGDTAIQKLKGKNLSLAECLGLVFLLV